MLAAELSNEIKKDTDCLWTLTKCIIAGSHTARDAAEGVACYMRLKEMLCDYYEGRLDVLDSSYLWFVERVLQAFEDTHTRFIVNST